MRWLADGVICIKAQYLLLSSLAHYVCVYVFLCVLQGKHFFFFLLYTHGLIVLLCFWCTFCAYETQFLPVFPLQLATEDILGKHMAFI